MSEWRRARDAGLLQGKAAGESVGRPSADQAEIARLRRELEVTQARLSRTETALQIMGKARELIKGVYYDAYVMIDIYSRYIVGARVHSRESGPLEQDMMREVFDTHGVPHVVHADRGTSMTSKSVADLLENLL